MHTCGTNTSIAAMHATSLIFLRYLYFLWSFVCMLACFCLLSVTFISAFHSCLLPFLSPFLPTYLESFLFPLFPPLSHYPRLKNSLFLISITLNFTTALYSLSSALPQVTAIDSAIFALTAIRKIAAAPITPALFPTSDKASATYVCPFGCSVIHIFVHTSVNTRTITITYTHLHWYVHLRSRK